ncbi:hypothetical protein [Photobacterium leiognathi]|uniref:hypothetical protein n=1 Tax=Photobacterium leiognathi TaxID=553611 RepID=UPI0027351E03|nr:hypothetical protein [Photobacterium leiognathi]
MMCRSTIPIAFKDVGANNDILKFNGFLASVDSIDEVCHFINKVENDHSLYLSLLNNGKEYAFKSSVDIQMKRMFDYLYE